MVEGYGEMDDGEEAIRVANGEIYVEDCEDPIAVSRILHKMGHGDLALDYDECFPEHRSQSYDVYSNRQDSSVTHFGGYGPKKLRKSIKDEKIETKSSTCLLVLFVLLIFLIIL